MSRRIKSEIKTISASLSRLEASLRPGKAKLEAAEVTDIDVLIGLMKTAEKNLSDAQHSVALLQKNPAKYAPQIENVRTALKSVFQLSKRGMALADKVHFRDFDPSNLAMTVQGNRAVITNLAESRSIPTKTGRTGRVKGSADVSQKLEELVGKDQNLRSKFADMIEKRADGKS